MSDAGYVKNEETGRKKKWWIAATIVLLILALPVLVPAAVGVGAAALGLIAALAGCGIAVLLGAGGCALAALVCLAAALLCAVVGTGFGLVMLFSTPASGLAVLGTSLLVGGAGILGCLIIWQFCRFLVWAARKFAGWLNIRLFSANKGKKTTEHQIKDQTVQEEDSHEE
ncbi:MAG: hypothetical protein Q4C58_03555 [Eubacteriales bacterium]|nr:hypothetical protein [Eubacteriales bacterium]